MSSKKDDSNKSKKSGRSTEDAKAHSPAAEPEGEAEADERQFPASARVHNANMKLVQQMMQTLQSAPGGGLPASKREAAVNQLLDTLQHAIFFRSETHEPYVLFSDEAHHRRVLPLRGRAFARLLARWFHQDAGVPAPVSALRQALELFEARAQEEHPPMPVYNRFGGQATPEGLHLWLDIGDRAGRAYCIKPAGISVHDQPAATFLRHPHQLALAPPQWPARKNGRVSSAETHAALADLRATLPLELPSDWLLIRAWMLAAMNPQIPAPMLCFVGPAGSGKTTAARLIRRLLDPSQAESFPLQPEERLALTLERHALPIFDNLGRLRPAQSNLFCRAVSGTSLVAHRGFSDEERIIRYRRAMILTSLEIPSAAPDWLERALVIKCRPLPAQERREEIEYWSAARKHMPAWLGALLLQQRETLMNYGNEPLPPLPRMADFAAWGAASMRADGRPLQEFFDALAANSRRLNDELLEADPLAAALLALMETRTEAWQGTAEQLLLELRQRDSLGRFKKYSPDMLGRRLRQIEPYIAQKLALRFVRNIGPRHVILEKKE